MSGSDIEIYKTCILVIESMPTVADQSKGNTK
jgi:hypothetical protein